MISEPDEEIDSYGPIHDDSYETEVFDVDSNEDAQSLIIPKTYK